MADIELLPLPEWTKRDDLGGLVPSQVRAGMHAYARANMEPLLSKVSVLSELAEFRGTTLAALDVAREDACELRRDNERLAKALRWYAEQAQLCRKFGSEGDAARHALSADGGKRANRALAQEDRNG